MKMLSTLTDRQSLQMYPMLAETGSTNDLNRKDRLYERKLDGVRCVALLDRDKTVLQGRSGSIITHRFPEIAEVHRQAKKPCVLDGEIAAVDFNSIQHRIHLDSPFRIKIARTQFPVVYYVFDILYLDGKSVREEPLIERKSILTSAFTPSPDAQILEWADSGESLFAEQKEKGLEGIMAKDRFAVYQEGKRCYAWLKVKNFKEAIFFICGVTEGENDRSDTFGSLVLGKLVEGKLVYVGNVGSGFRKDQLDVMLSLLTRHQGECPFEIKPDTDRPVKFWTRPDIRCEVRYLDVPTEKLRFPTYRKVM